MNLKAFPRFQPWKPQELGEVSLDGFSSRFLAGRGRCVWGGVRPAWWLPVFLIELLSVTTAFASLQQTLHFSRISDPSE